MTYVDVGQLFRLPCGPFENGGRTIPHRVRLARVGVHLRGKRVQLPRRHPGEPALEWSYVGVQMLVHPDTSITADRILGWSSSSASTAA